MIVKKINKVNHYLRLRSYFHSTNTWMESYLINSIRIDYNSSKIPQLEIWI